MNQQGRKATQELRYDEQAKERKRFAVLLVGASLFLLTFAFTLKPDQKQTGRMEMHSLSDAERRDRQLRRIRAPKTFDQRVQEHMRETGEELNRQRIRTQYQNLFTRPLPSGVPAPKPSDSVLRGIPLEAEGPSFEKMIGEPSQTRSLAYPDADINSSIQNQRVQLRQLEELTQMERREYLEQFIRNAEAMGYRVKIDKDYNVEYAPIEEYEGQRGPSRIPDSESASAGSGTRRAH